MKAIVVSAPGDPDQLTLTDVPDPLPGNDEILVSVIAAGLNFIDTYHRSGLYPMEMPFTPGLEGAGTVLAVGPGVTQYQPGDAVCWTWAIGSYAEKVVIPADQAIPLPEDVAPTVAAALLLQGITAHYLATDTFPLKEDDRCLIHAGAGGVGLLLTQIAKMAGAEVFTTVGSKEKAELSTGAGADHVILYNETDFKEEVEEIAGPGAIDVVYDGVGAATFLKGLDLLRARGMLVTFGNASGPPPEISPLILAGKGSLFLTRPTMAHYTATRQELLSRTTDLFDWVSEGRLDVRIGAEFALADAAEAHRALEGRSTTGKVLIRP
ncbi:MAG: quinone oxidoreductase [Actinomycetota bacterium]|nr:quinone oxidoreductase [Actinomycetota bacterium]MDK1037504.1 quinone oxidoreductase [Actinomycetota bacterium]MDK1104177.1 quinone oxidoreductase [Actinomycetota bacterium]MDK1292025.1 quinone oxidoreductase [Actinomycetota bacterium]